MKKFLYYLYVTLWTAACGIGIAYYAIRNDIAGILVLAGIAAANYLYLGLRRRRTRRTAK